MNDTRNKEKRRQEMRKKDNLIVSLEDKMQKKERKNGM